MGVGDSGAGVLMSPRIIDLHVSIEQGVEIKASCRMVKGSGGCKHSLPSLLSTAWILPPSQVGFNPSRETAAPAEEVGAPIPSISAETAFTLTGSLHPCNCRVPGAVQHGGGAPGKITVALDNNQHSFNLACLPSAKHCWMQF